MKTSLREIASLVDGELIGEGDTVITGIAGIKEAKRGEITFLANGKYAENLETTKASAVIVSSEIEEASKPVIRSDHPYLAFTKVMGFFVDNEIPHPQGIHPTAVVGEGAKIGDNVALGAYVVVEPEATIGDNSVLYPGVYVGYGTRIGSDCLIYPHVTIREKISIGDRNIIHSGTVIGSDGFGFAQFKGIHHKIPQAGTVTIGDDVEIGANTTVDRATIGQTIIGKGTKIDNLVQIAHNVKIGDNCIVVAQVGISGSATIGNGVTIAGQAGIAGHVTIEDQAVIAARAGITKRVPGGACYSGYPAIEHKRDMKVSACLKRLPEQRKTVADLEERLKKVEGLLEKMGE